MEKIIYFAVILLLGIGLYFQGIIKNPFNLQGRLKRIEMVKKQSAKEKFADWVKASPMYKFYFDCRLQAEISEGLAVLRNLILSSDEITLTTDMALEKLAQNSKNFESLYYKILAFVRTGDMEQGRMVFLRLSDAPLCEEYVNLIFSCDELEARLLLEILLSMQRSIRESNLTASRKRDELVSDLLYVPAVFNVMLVFVNFIYVGYFIEQKEILSKVFG